MLGFQLIPYKRALDCNWGTRYFAKGVSMIISDNITYQMSVWSKLTAFAFVVTYSLTGGEVVFTHVVTT
jgi:hypothetical protein